MKLNGNIIFSFIVLLFFVFGLCLSFSWSAEARLFPSLITVTGTILSAWLCLTEIIHTKNKENRLINGKKKRLTISEKSEKTTKSEVIIIMWILTFIGLIMLLGFWVAIGVFIPLFMHFFGRESWKISASYMIGIWFLIYFIFSVTMKLPLYGGLIGLAW